MQPDSAGKPVMRIAVESGVRDRSRRVGPYAKRLDFGPKSCRKLDHATNLTVMTCLPKRVW